MFARTRLLSVKNNLSLGTFSHLHQRTASLKSQGIPLIPLEGPPSPDFDLFSVYETEHEPELDDNPGGAFDGPSTFQVIDMNVPEQVSTSLPPPALQKRSPESSAHKDRRDCEDDDTNIARLKKYLLAEVDGELSTAPLSAYCFMTGFIDAVTFSAIFVWCAFQTGNSVQLSLALARLFNGQHDHSFHIADQQALCSVLTFIFGAFIGRLGDKFGCKTRLWLALGTLIQAIFTMIAAVSIWKSHQGSVADSRANPAWTNTLSFVCLGFMSASMGLQGIMGKRVNTQFTTTVVLTTTWCELMADPKLFDIRRMVISRDHKIMAIGSLFLGGFIGRALIDKIGSAGTLGIGTGIRLAISAWWVFVPEKKAKK